MAGALSGDWDAQVRRGVVASVRQELGAPVSIILGYAEMLIEDAAQLIPNLMANPEALAQMQRNARQGQHLSWLQLQRPAVTTH